MSTPESADPVQRPKSGSKWALGVLGVVFLLILAVEICVSLRGTSTLNDTDFRLTARQVPPVDDAVVQLRALAGRFDFYPFASARGLERNPIIAMLDEGADVDDDVAGDFANAEAPDFAALDHILSLPYFGSNDLLRPDQISDEARAIQRARRVTNVIGSYRLRAHDYTGAVTDALRVRRLAMRFTEDQVLTVDVLYAMVADANAARMVANLLNDQGLPPEQLARLQANWGVARWNFALQLSLNGEYCFFAGMLQSPRSFAPPKNLSWPAWQSYWNRIMALQDTSRQELLNYFRDLRIALSKPYAKVDQTAIHAWLASSGATGKFPPTRAFTTGGGLLSARLNEWPGYLQSAYLATATDRLITAGLAVRHYYDDHHALPAKLEDLVPSYLPAVPLDPFDGKPLRYDAVRGLIYSVGTLLRDAGGSKRPMKAAYSADNDPLTDSDQPTLQLTFQNPATSKSP